MLKKLCSVNIAVAQYSSREEEGTTVKPEILRKYATKCMKIKVNKLWVIRTERSNPENFRTCA
jgi:hypothetical protein